MVSTQHTTLGQMDGPHVVQLSALLGSNGRCMQAPQIPLLHPSSGVRSAGWIWTWVGGEGGEEPPELLVSVDVADDLIAPGRHHRGSGNADKGRPCSG